MKVQDQAQPFPPKRRVRAKMQVWKIDHLNSTDPEQQAAQVELNAVYNDGDEANANWSRWTPSGSVRLTITNPSAISAFEQGKFYYIDFTPVE